MTNNDNLMIKINFNIKRKNDERKLQNFKIFEILEF